MGDTVTRVGARVLSSVFLGVFFLLVARGVSVADFGQLIFAYTLGIATGLVAGLGAPMQVLRHNAAGDGESSAPRLYVVHSVVVTALFLLAISALLAIDTPLMVVAGVVFAYSDTVQNYAQSHLAGSNSHRRSSTLSVVHRLIPMLVVIGAVVTGGTVTAAVLIIGFTITAVIGLLAPLPLIPRSSLRTAISGRFQRPATGTGGYWALGMSGILAQLQVAAFAVFATANAVGLLALASRVTGPLTLLSAAMSTVLIPELAKHLSDRDRFEGIYRRFVAVTVGYCILVLLLAWPAAWVIVQIVGDEYRPALPILIGMIVAAGISSVSQSISARHIALGRPRLVTVAIVSGGLLTLGLLLLFGAIGAIGVVWIAPVAGQLTVLGLLLAGSAWGAKGIPRRRRWEYAAAVTAALACVLVVPSVHAAGNRSEVGNRAPQPASTAPLETPPSVRILVIGDSLTAGTKYGGNADFGWPLMIQRRLAAASLNQCPVMLRISGRGGAGYATPGQRHTTFESEAKRLMTPDISAVVLMGSNNDSRAAEMQEAGVVQTIEQIRRVSPDVPIAVLPSPWVRAEDPSAAYFANAATLRRVAAEYPGVRFRDPYEEGWFTGMDFNQVLGRDGVHPTDAGHVVFADRLEPMFREFARRGRCER
ncbi:GDSL-type esterase/lipase family protein [Gordonia iterans]